MRDQARVRATLAAVGPVTFFVFAAPRDLKWCFPRARAPSRSHGLVARPPLQRLEPAGSWPPLARVGFRWHRSQIVAPYREPRPLPFSACAIRAAARS